MVHGRFSSPSGSSASTDFRVFFASGWRDDGAQFGSGGRADDTDGHPLVHYPVRVFAGGALDRRDRE